MLCDGVPSLCTQIYSLNCNVPEITASINVVLFVFEFFICETNAVLS